MYVYMYMYLHIHVHVHVDVWRCSMATVVRIRATTKASGDSTHKGVANICTLSNAHQHWKRLRHDTCAEALSDTHLYACINAHVHVHVHTQVHVHVHVHVAVWRFTFTAARLKWCKSVKIPGPPHNTLHLHVICTHGYIQCTLYMTKCSTELCTVCQSLWTHGELHVHVHACIGPSIVRLTVHTTPLRTTCT